MIPRAVAGAGEAPFVPRLASTAIATAVAGGGSRFGDQDPKKLVINNNIKFI